MQDEVKQEAPSAMKRVQGSERAREGGRKERKEKERPWRSVEAFILAAQKGSFSSIP
jgi:hypothetical protein